MTPRVDMVEGETPGIRGRQAQLTAQIRVLARFVLKYTLRVRPRTIESEFGEFSFICQSWRGKPLRTLATIVSLSGATTASTGLNVYCDVDENDFPKSVAIDDAQIEALDTCRAEFHGEWNYTFLPTPQVDAVIS